MSHTVPVNPDLQPSPPAPLEPVDAWVRVVTIATAIYLAAGLVAGWVWQRSAPLAHYTVDETGASLGEEEMTRVFGPDGSFVSIGFVAGLVLGAAIFWWLRARGAWTIAVVVLGSAVGSGAAWGVGMLLGHDPLDPRLAAASPGDLVAAPLELHAWSALAAWPVGAALAAALLAALSWRSEPATPPTVQASEQTPWNN